MMRIVLVVVCVVGLMGMALAETTPSLSIMKVAADSKAEYLRLYQMGLDIVETPPDPEVTIVGSDADKSWLESQGYTVSYVLQDAERFYANRATTAGAAAMGGFRTLSEIWLAVDSIIAEYPAVVSAKYNIGTTLEGRPMYAIRISDNPSTDEPSEPAILFTGLHHAREPIGPHLLIYTMRQLASNYGIDPTITNLIDNREIWFIPIVNPDGYAYNELIAPTGGGMWRKNRRNNGDGSWGVDINRNYGYHWGEDDAGSSPDPNDETYRGTAAFSEPETQHMRDFCYAHTNITVTMNYHSYSNLLLYPWGYYQGFTPDHLIFAAMADSAVTFNGYAAGPGWGLYLTNGDSDDWMYGSEGILSFTPEVGTGSDGFWPNPSRIEPLTLENYQPNLLFTELADQPGRILPPAVAVWDSIWLAGTDSLGLAWHNDDTLNPPIGYDVMELYGGGAAVDGLEDGSSNWDLAGFLISTDNVVAGSHALYSRSFNSYQAFAQTSQPYSVGDHDTLTFWADYDIEMNYDYAYVEVSTDGGQFFSPIEGNITTMTNPFGNNRGHGITGTSGGWMEGRFPLDFYAGQEVFVRFAYYTDTWVTGFGMYVDDIYPVQKFDSVVVVASGSDTEQTLTGYPAGTYSFRVQTEDAQGQLSTSQTLSFTYESGPTYMIGDVNETNTITSADIIYLVGYVFKSGPAPLPEWQAGDVDASGAVTSADIVYLVNYVFRDGPPPVEP